MRDRIIVITALTKSYLIYMLLLPVYLISYVIPKNKNIWIFGSWFGLKFADNSKALYLYVKHNEPIIRPIWISKNKQLIKQLSENGYESYYKYSIKSFYYSAIAGVAIVCNSYIDEVNYFLHGRAKKIQLWHGTALKMIGVDARNTSQQYYTNLNKTYRWLYRVFISKVFSFAYPEFDLMISPSDEARNKFKSAFSNRVSPENIVITGYPRNDILFDEFNMPKNLTTDDYLGKVRSKVNTKYTIIYLPTLRERKNVDLFIQYNFDAKKVQNLLEKLNATLIIKAHFCNKIPFDANEYKNIFVASEDDIPDIYTLLKDIDILITDYSSVYFDFLLLNRPIIFAPFDEEEYISKERKLYYNYNSVTPGPKAKYWDDVMNFLIEAINDPGKYKKERIKINKLFNKYNDSNSSKRVCEQIVNIICKR